MCRWMVDARLCQRVALGTWGVSAARDHSPTELPSRLWLWGLAMPGAWFGNSAVLQLLGASRSGTAENWLSWGMGRWGSRCFSSPGLESTAENLGELGVQVWHSWALWWSSTQAAAVGAGQAGMWQGGAGEAGITWDRGVSCAGGMRGFSENAPKKAWWLK